MKIFKSRVFWFILGFLIGPFVVGTGFNQYMKWSLQKAAESSPQTQEEFRKRFENPNQQ